ncbi:MAG: family 10 glycosylhydrolase [Elusimicrobia bacterium]|nr:family 10 glycosylhydrolase [Elusimicrobiota bacterium]
MRTLLLLLLAVPSPARDLMKDPVPSVPPATRAAALETRAGWVVGWRQMTSRKGVDEALAWAKAAGLDTLFVQVRVSGDAYYRSDLTPRAEALKEQGDFDPLGYALEKGHKQGLKIHAYLNMGVIWRGLTPPLSPLHVFNAHPAWILHDVSGKIAFPGKDDPTPSVVEGNVWVEWADPDLRAHLAAVAGEVASRYPVDGVHLDFVRYPARMGPRTPAAGKGPATHTREGDEWREAQVTAGLRGVRDAVKAARPGTPVSAAVLAAWSLAEGRNFTAYRRWVEDGTLDFAVLMDYFPDVAWVRQALQNSVETLDPSRVIAGFSVKAHPPERVAEQIEWGRELGLRGFCLFSLDRDETPNPSEYLAKLRALAIPDRKDDRYASREPLWIRVGTLDAERRSWTLRFYSRRGNAKLVVYPRGLAGMKLAIEGKDLPPLSFQDGRPAVVDLRPFLKPFERETAANHDFLLKAEAEGEGRADVFVVDYYAN